MLKILNFLKTLSFPILAIVLLTSCSSTFTNDKIKFNNSYYAGDYKGASKSISDKSVNVFNKSTASFQAQDFLSAKKEFSTAEDLVNSNEESGLMSDSLNSATDVFASAYMHSYTPMLLDGVYLSTYQFLNALGTENYDDAKIRVGQIYNRQGTATEYFRKNIAKANEQLAQDKADSSNSSGNYDQAMNKVDQYYADISRWKSYGDFVNPYSTYLAGLFYMLRSEDSSDRERASTYLRRAHGMEPNNQFVSADLNLNESIANGGSKADLKGNVWIIFENGMIADLDEIRIDIPVFTGNGMIISTLSLPKPRKNALAYKYVEIKTHGQHVSTERIADMDAVFVQEFKAKYPIVVGKAILSTISKTILQVQMQKRNDKGFGALAATLYSMGTSSADLRSWFALPKEVQIAKIKCPKSGEVKIYSPNGALLGTTTVNAGGNSIVYIRIPTAQAQPSIITMNL